METVTAPSAILGLHLLERRRTTFVDQPYPECICIYLIYAWTNTSVSIRKCACLCVLNFIATKKVSEAGAKARPKHICESLWVQNIFYICSSSEMHKQLANEKVASCQGSWQSCTKKCNRHSDWQSAEQNSMDHFTCTLGTLYKIQVNWCSIQI